MRYTAGRFALQVWSDLSGVKLELAGWNDAVRPEEIAFQEEELEDLAYIVGRALALRGKRNRPTNGS
jgi:hypothetical protein